jgi:hypothetical protein
LGLAAMAAACLATGVRADGDPAAPGSAGPGASAPPEHGHDSSGVESDTSELAKKLQNPIGDLISVPFQTNFNFDYGPQRGTQELLNIQPVIPIHISKDWNIITRTILPLIWQPSLQPVADTVPFGTGPTTFTAFLSPSVPKNGFLWGVGPVAQLPTISSRTLGSNVWGGGPSAVVVLTKGHIVAGALINNVWSFGGTTGPGGTRYNLMTLQPFFNYNLKEGWYLSTSPLMTANWMASGDQAWTVPLGGALGRVIRFGKLPPLNFKAGFYDNVARPRYAADWQLQTQITAIF